ncbi:MAG: mechanosensitive ion channel domain-containing protein [Celeribacter sp.]|jgi:small-conductance mechanosensitive channel
MLLPRLILLLFVVATTLLPAGPGTAQDAQPTGAIALEPDPAQDAAIAARMRQILTALREFPDVTVSVEAGIVTLSGETLDPAAVERLTAIASRIDGAVAIRSDLVESAELSKRLSPAMERFRRRIEQMLAFLPLAAVALAVGLVVVFAGLMLARWNRPWQRLAPNAFIADIYRQMVRIAFLIAAMVIALDILNATALLSTILGAAGIIGLAIGFAVRDTVENFIASVMLSIRQPFRPNDLVEIEGDTGKVIRLTSRATILLSLDGNQIRIPNATVFKGRVVNFTRNRERRFLFGITVDAASDVTAIRKLAEDTVQALPFTLATPAASVWIEEINDAGLLLQVTGWIDQRHTSFPLARGEALRLVKAAIEAAGVSLPENAYRLRFDLPPGLTGLIPSSATVTEDDAAQDAVPRPDEAAEAPAQQTSPPVSTLATAADDVSAGDDEALARIVDAERRETGNNDLLNHTAPEE